MGNRDSGGAGGARARAREIAHLDRTSTGRSAACDMPMEREKTRIVDDLHARGWDEREDTGQNVSCTGSVTLRGPIGCTFRAHRVVRVVWEGTRSESAANRISFLFVSLAQAHSHGRANGWGWEVAEG